MSKPWASLDLGNVTSCKSGGASCLGTLHFDHENGEVMISKHWKRGASVIAAGALLLAGSTAAQALSNDQINPASADVYLGWHQDHADGDDNFDARWDALHLGLGGSSQIIKGLVDTGEIPADSVTAEELIEIIESSAVGNPTGAVYYQIGLYYVNSAGEDKWTTLRPNTPAGTPDENGWYTLGEEDWRGTFSLAGIDPQPLPDFLEATGSNEFKIASFGVFAQTPSSVEAIAFGGETEFFGFEEGPVYSFPEEATAGSLSDLIVADGTDAVQVCEGVEFSGNGSAAVRYNTAIEIAGDTIEDRWGELTSLIDFRVQWKHYDDENPAVEAPIHIAYGDTLESSTEISITLLDGSDVLFEGDLDGFTSGAVENGLDVAQALVESGNVWITGLTVQTDGVPTILTSIALGNSVNVSFAGDCESDGAGDLEDGSTGGGLAPSAPSDDAAQPVKAQPVYAG